MKQWGFFWSSNGWSRPSKVSKNTCFKWDETLSVKILITNCHFEHSLVATYCNNIRLRTGRRIHWFTSALRNYIALFLNCITAPIMWVKVCPPSKWVGPDPKPGETQLPVVLCHTWPSYPVSPHPTHPPPTHRPSVIAEKAGQTLATFHSCHPTKETHYSSWNIIKRLWSLGCDSVVSPAAVVDLNGRYFGGRVVKACFYNLDKFRVLDLGEQVWTTQVTILCTYEPNFLFYFIF